MAGNGAGSPERDSDEPRPLGAYAALAAVVNAGISAALIARRDRLPERMSAADIALMGITAHKVSRIVAKDKVTSFLRAPFVRYEGPAGPGEVTESPRGEGLRRAVGELLVCPYCLSHWVAGGYAAGLLFAPRGTRFVGAMFAAETISDFLQIAYRAGQEQL